MNNETNQVTETKTCCVCCRPVSNPFRRIVDGKTVAGCIAKDHDGQLYGSSAEWHNRPVAKQWRKEQATWLRNIGR